MTDRAMTLTEASRLGYGKKDKLYQANREGRLQLRKNGRLTIVTPADWLAYVNSIPKFQPSQGASGAPRRRSKR